MTERRTEDLQPEAARAVMEGNEMSNSTTSAPAIAVPTEAVDLVRGSLAPRNSVGEASVAFYVAALAAAGVSDPDSLTFAETVEVTRRLYAPSADFRRTSADIAKVERDAAKAAAKAKRDAEREARTLEEIAKLEAKLAAKKATNG